MSSRLGKSKHRLRLRIISLLLTGIFFSQNLGLAQGLSSADTTNVRAYYVPQDVGLIKDTHQVSSKETIINIKDIHDNWSAQESIASILEHLLRDYDIQTIGIEGTVGMVDTSIVSAFPDENIKAKTARRLTKEGLLSAGELFSILHEGRVAVYGMEDEKLYQENLQSFKEALSNQKTNYRLVRALTEALASLAEKTYSEELLEITSNGVLAVNGGMKFSTRWKSLREQAKKFGIDVLQYENIQTLLSCIDIEKQVDFPKVNVEREALMDKLTKALDKDGLEKLVLESVDYKLGRISQAGFSSFLLDTAKSHSLNPTDYPNLVLYAKYMALYESIDVEALKDQVESLEDAVREKLFKNDSERELFQIQKDAKILQDLFEVRLTSSSLAYFKNNRSHFEADRFKDFLNSSSDPSLFKNVDIDSIFNNVSGVVSFYESAEKRNKALLDNMIKKMREKGQSVGCLVTGGFHSRGITELMDSGQMSYLVVLPRFNKEATRPYLTIITSMKDSYRDFAESQEVLDAKQRATAYLFAQSAYQVMKANQGEDTEKAQAMVRKETERLKILYMNNFRASQRKLKETDAEVSANISSQSNPLIKTAKQVTVNNDYIAVRSLMVGMPVIQGLEVSAAGNEVTVNFEDGQAYKVELDENGEIKSVEVQTAVIQKDAGNLTPSQKFLNADSLQKLTEALQEAHDALEADLSSGQNESDLREEWIAVFKKAADSQSQVDLISAALKNLKTESSGLLLRQAMTMAASKNGFNTVPIQKSCSACVVPWVTEAPGADATPALVDVLEEGQKNNRTNVQTIDEEFRKKEEGEIKYANPFDDIEAFLKNIEKHAVFAREKLSNDTADRLDKVLEVETDAAHKIFPKDIFPKKKTVVQSNGSVVTETLDEAGKPVSRQTTDAQGNVLAEDNFIYDADGNITSHEQKDFEKNTASQADNQYKNGTLASKRVKVSAMNAEGLAADTLSEQQIRFDAAGVEASSETWDYKAGTVTSRATNRVDKGKRPLNYTETVRKINQSAEGMLGESISSKTIEPNTEESETEGERLLRTTERVEIAGGMSKETVTDSTREEATGKETPSSRKESIRDMDGNLIEEKTFVYIKGEWKKAAEKDSAGNSTQYQYDDAGVLTSKTVNRPDGSVVKSNFKTDGNGQTIETVVITDSKGNFLSSTETVKDKEGRLVTVTITGMDHGKKIRTIQNFEQGKLNTAETQLSDDADKVRSSQTLNSEGKVSKDEAFTYNSFNQVTSHETVDYESRKRMLISTNYTKDGKPAQVREDISELNEFNGTGRSMSENPQGPITEVIKEKASADEIIAEAEKLLAGKTMVTSKDREEAYKQAEQNLSGQVKEISTTRDAAGSVLSATTVFKDKEGMILSQTTVKTVDGIMTRTTETHQAGKAVAAVREILNVVGKLVSKQTMGADGKIISEESFTYNAAGRETSHEILDFVNNQKKVISSNYSSDGKPARVRDRVTSFKEGVGEKLLRESDTRLDAQGREVTSQAWDYQTGTVTLRMTTRVDKNNQPTQFNETVQKIDEAAPGMLGQTLSSKTIERNTEEHEVEGQMLLRTTESYTAENDTATEIVTESSREAGKETFRSRTETSKDKEGKVLSQKNYDYVGGQWKEQISESETPSNAEIVKDASGNILSSTTTEIVNGNTRKVTRNYQNGFETSVVSETLADMGQVLVRETVDNQLRKRTLVTNQYSKEGKKGRVRESISSLTESGVTGELLQETDTRFDAKGREASKESRDYKEKTLNVQTTARVDAQNRPTEYEESVHTMDAEGNAGDLISKKTIMRTANPAQLEIKEELPGEKGVLTRSETLIDRQSDGTERTLSKKDQLYDKGGKLLSETDYEYDAEGTLLSKTITEKVNEKTFKTTESYKDGVTSYFTETFDSEGKLLAKRVTDAEGKKTFKEEIFVYNVSGNVISHETSDYQTNQRTVLSTSYSKAGLKAGVREILSPIDVFGNVSSQLLSESDIRFDASGREASKEVWDYKAGTVTSRATVHVDKNNKADQFKETIRKIDNSAPGLAGAYISQVSVKSSAGADGISISEEVIDADGRKTLRVKRAEGESERLISETVYDKEGALESVKDYHYSVSGQQTGYTVTGADASTTETSTKTASAADFAAEASRFLAASGKKEITANDREEAYKQTEAKLKGQVTVSVISKNAAGEFLSSDESTKNSLGETVYSKTTRVNNAEYALEGEVLLTSTEVSANADGTFTETVTQLSRTEASGKEKVYSQSVTVKDKAGKVISEKSAPAPTPAPSPPVEVKTKEVPKPELPKEKPAVKTTTERAPPAKPVFKWDVYPLTNEDLEKSLKKARRWTESTGAAKWKNRIKDQIQQRQEVLGPREAARVSMVTTALETASTTDETVLQDFGGATLGESVTAADIRTATIQALQAFKNQDVLKYDTGEEYVQILIEVNGEYIEAYAKNIRGSIIVIAQNLLKGMNLSAEEYFSLMNLGMYVEQANHAGLEKGIDSPYVMVGLEKSAHLFENHNRDGLIGVNHTALRNNSAALSENQKALLVVGLMHELYHEAQPAADQTPDNIAAFEANRLPMDIELTYVLLDAMGLEAAEYTEEIKTIFGRAESIYAEALQESLTGQQLVQPLTQAEEEAQATSRFSRFRSYFSKAFSPIFSRFSKQPDISWLKETLLKPVYGIAEISEYAEGDRILDNEMAAIEKLDEAALLTMAKERGVEEIKSKADLDENLKLKLASESKAFDAWIKQYADSKKQQDSVEYALSVKAFMRTPSGYKEAGSHQLTYKELAAALREDTSKAAEIRKHFGIVVDAKGQIYNEKVLDLGIEILSKALGLPNDRIVASASVKAREFARLKKQWADSFDGLTNSQKIKRSEQIKKLLEYKALELQKKAQDLRKNSIEEADKQKILAEALAFGEVSFELISGFSMTAAQKIMLGLFMQRKSVGLMAGGGKTGVYLVYHGVMKILLGEDYSGVLFAENEGGVNNFMTGIFNRASYSQLAASFGLKLINGDALQSARGKEASAAKEDLITLGKALNSSNQLLVMSYTTGSHVNNIATKDGGELMNLIKQKSATRVGTIDELHLLGINRNSATLGGPGGAFETKEMSMVKDVALKLFDFKKGAQILKEAKTNSVDKAFLFDVVYAYNLEEKKQIVEEYKDKEVIVILKENGVEADVEVTEKLKEAFGTTVESSVIQSVIRGLRAMEGKDYAAEINPNEKEKGRVISPMTNGEPSFDSIISDVNYQAAIALKTLTMEHGESNNEWMHSGQDGFIDTLVEDSAKMVRRSDTAMQVAIVESLHMFSENMVGATGTPAGLESLILASIGADLVSINASQMDLASYELLNLPAEQEKWLGTKAKPGRLLEKLTAKDAPITLKAEDLKRLETLSDRLKDSSETNQSEAQSDFIFFMGLYSVQQVHNEKGESTGKDIQFVRSSLIASSDVTVRKQLQERYTAYGIAVKTLDAYTNLENKDASEDIISNASKDERLVEAEKQKKLADDAVEKAVNALSAAKEGETRGDLTQLEKNIMDAQQKAQEAERGKVRVQNEIREDVQKRRAIGKIILIDELGWTGRDYKTEDGINSDKIGIDLIVAGFEDMTETKFVQLTGRNKRGTKFGDRFMLASEGIMLKRLKDMEIAQIRDEMIGKWGLRELFKADAELAAAESVREIASAQAKREAVINRMKRDVDFHQKMTLYEGIQHVQKIAEAGNRIKMAQQKIETAKTGTDQAKITEAENALASAETALQAAKDEFTFKPMVTLHARLLATRAISEGARHAIQDVLKNRAVTDQFKPYFTNKGVGVPYLSRIWGIHYLLSFSGRQISDLESVFKKFLKQDTFGADIVAKIRELSGKDNYAYEQIYAALDKAEMAWKEVLKFQSFGFSHPIARFNAQIQLRNIQQAQKDLKNWASEVKERREAIGILENTIQSTRDEMEGASNSEKKDLQKMLVNLEYRLDALKRQGVSDYAEAKRNVQKIGFWRRFSSYWTGRGEMYQTLKNTFEVADNTAHKNLVLSGKSSGGMRIKSEEIIQIRNESGKVVQKVSAKLRGTRDGLSIDAQTLKGILKKSGQTIQNYNQVKAYAMVEEGGLRITIEDEYHNLYDHFIASDAIKDAYAVGTRMEGQIMASQADPKGRSVYFKPVHTMLQPSMDSVEAAKLFFMPHQSFMAAVKSIYSGDDDDLKDLNGGTLEQMSGRLGMNYLDFVSALKTTAALFTKIMDQAIYYSSSFSLSVEEFESVEKMSGVFNSLIGPASTDTTANLLASLKEQLPALKQLQQKMKGEPSKDEQYLYFNLKTQFQEKEKAFQDTLFAISLAKVLTQNPVGSRWNPDERLRRLARAGFASSRTDLQSALTQDVPEGSVEFMKNFLREHAAELAVDDTQTLLPKETLIAEAQKQLALASSKPASELKIPHYEKALDYYNRALLTFIKGDTTPERTEFARKAMELHKMLAQDALTEAGDVSKDENEIAAALLKLENHARQGHALALQINDAATQTILLEVLKNTAEDAYKKGNFIAARLLFERLKVLDPAADQFALVMDNLNAKVSVQERRLAEEATNLLLAGKPSATQEERDNPFGLKDARAAHALLLPYVGFFMLDDKALSGDLIKLYAEVHHKTGGQSRVFESPELSAALREQARYRKRMAYDESDTTQWLLTAATQASAEKDWLSYDMGQLLINPDEAFFLKNVLAGGLRRMSKKEITSMDRALVAQAALHVFNGNEKTVRGEGGLINLFTVNPANREKAEKTINSVQEKLNTLLELKDKYVRTKATVRVRGGVNLAGDIFFHTYSVDQEAMADIANRTPLNQLSPRDYQYIQEADENHFPIMVLNQLDLLDDKGTNVAQKEGSDEDITLVVFKNRIGAWTQNNVIPKIDGEEKKFYEMVESDFKKIRNGESTALIYLSPDGFFNFINPTAADNRFPKASKELQAINGEYNQKMTVLDKKYNAEDPDDRIKMMDEYEKIFKKKLSASKTLVTLFQREFPNSEVMGDNAKIVDGVTEGFFQHEIQHIVDDKNGVGDFWKKSGNAEDVQAKMEVGSHLRSMTNSRTPFFFLGQVLTLMLLQTSGEGYTKAAQTILSGLADVYGFSGFDRNSLDPESPQWNELVNFITAQEEKPGNNGLLQKNAAIVLESYLAKEFKKAQKSKKKNEEKLEKPVVSDKAPSVPMVLSPHTLTTSPPPPPPTRLGTAAEYAVRIREHIKKIGLSDVVLKRIAFDLNAQAEKAKAEADLQGVSSEKILEEMFADLELIKQALPFQDTTYESASHFVALRNKASDKLRQSFGAVKNHLGPGFTGVFPDMTPRFIAIDPKKWATLEVTVAGGKKQKVRDSTKAIAVFGANVVLIPALDEEKQSDNQLLGLMLHEGGHLMSVDYFDLKLREGLTEFRARQMLEELEGPDAVDEYMALNTHKPAEGLYAEEVEAVRILFGHLSGLQIDTARVTGDISHVQTNTRIEGSRLVTTFASAKETPDALIGIVTSRDIPQALRERFPKIQFVRVEKGGEQGAKTLATYDQNGSIRTQILVDVPLSGTESDAAVLDAAIRPAIDQASLRSFISAYIYAAGLRDMDISVRGDGTLLQQRLLKVIADSLNDARSLDVEYLLMEKPESPAAVQVSTIDMLKVDAINALLGGTVKAESLPVADEQFVEQQIKALTAYQAAVREESGDKGRLRGELLDLQMQLEAHLGGKPAEEAASIIASHEQIAVAQGIENEMLEYFKTNSTDEPQALVFDARLVSGLADESAVEALIGLNKKLKSVNQQQTRIVSYVLADPDDEEKFSALGVGGVISLKPGQKLGDLSISINGGEIPRQNRVLVTSSALADEALAGIDKEASSNLSSLVFIGQELESPSRMAPTLGLMALVKKTQNDRPVLVTAGSRALTERLNSSGLAGLFNLIELTRFNLSEYLNEFKKALRGVLSSA